MNITMLAQGAEAINRLTELNDLIDERPQLIRAAHDSGVNWTDLAALLRVDRSTVVRMSKADQ